MNIFDNQLFKDIFATDNCIIHESVSLRYTY